MTRGVFRARVCLGRDLLPAPQPHLRFASINSCPLFFSHFQCWRAGIVQGTMKTVELGRAVISFAEKNVQLWSTTSITLSPLQTSLDLQSLNHQLLSRLLASGKVWVCRGDGLQLRIEISAHGEPLDFLELNRLAEKIVDAPVCMFTQP